jgi:hypothetical protein
MSQRTWVFRAPMMKRVVLGGILLLACRGNGADDTDRGETQVVPAEPAPAGSDVAAGDTAAPDMAVRDTAARLSDRERELIAAAERVIGFLRGAVPFDDIDVADTVSFHLPAAAGGGRTVLPADSLRDRERWHVRTDHGQVHSLVPPRSLDVLTMRVGRHLRCFEYDLAASFPELPGRPHVGTMLRPRQYDSCLQTWNLTLIFDQRQPRPRLIGAAYDQWEW